MCARLSYSPDPFLDGASEKVAFAGAPLLATIIEVEQGCPIPRVRDVKTQHRKQEEGGAIE